MILTQAESFPKLKNEALMSTYMMAKVQITNGNSNQLLETTRDIGRALQQQKQCSAFLPINRSGEGRVDCYLFDITIQRNEIQQLFLSSLNCPIDVKEEEMSRDLELVKSAAIVVEILLTQYQENERPQKLLYEHFHYVLNSLQLNYLAEIDFYLYAVHEIANILSNLASKNTNAT